MAVPVLLPHTLNLALFFHLLVCSLKIQDPIGRTHAGQTNIVPSEIANERPGFLQGGWIEFTRRAV